MSLLEVYDSWRGPLYPEDLPKREWLHYYATQFSTVEINSPFYRTPSLEAVRSWRSQTPDDFRFAWKASKFITHWKQLTDKCENSIALMQTRLKALSPKSLRCAFPTAAAVSQKCRAAEFFSSAIAAATALCL